MTTATKSEALVLVSKQNGIVVIPAATPLTRLNYFDGKFLRASDLKAEQDYLRHLVRQSNQAGGSGVAHGFDVTLAGGDLLEIGPGLAIDPDGRVLLSPQSFTIGVQELIDQSQNLQQLFGKSTVVTDAFETCELIAEAPPVNVSLPSDIYLIVISPAEALCGEEDVFGKLCEEACATSTDRPFVVEGLVVRAIPLVLKTPLPSFKGLTQKHLRSRIASAYFEDERHRVASLISKLGLQQITWCLGADAQVPGGVPIGVIARAGSTTIFLDAWIARRERIDSPARRYWQWRMMMRPWDVFLAQILQFQCQLRDIFKKGPIADDDPCEDARAILGETARAIADMLKQYKEVSGQINFGDAATGKNQVELFKQRVADLEAANSKIEASQKALDAAALSQMLITGGIIELPSAGYLPVVPSSMASIQRQVRALMGDGVDLRFCVVRPDFVAHALEEAQHMERISLIEGLENPKLKPQVDILVPGEAVAETPATTLQIFEAPLELAPTMEQANADNVKQTIAFPKIPFRGAARAEALPAGGGAVYLACTSPTVNSPFDLPSWQKLAGDGTSTGAVPTEPAELGLWMSFKCEQDLFQLKPGSSTNISVQMAVAANAKASVKLELLVELNALLTLTEPKSAFPVEGTAKGDLTLRGEGGAPTTVSQELTFLAKQNSKSSLEVQLASGSAPRYGLTLTIDWSDLGKVNATVAVEYLATARMRFKFPLAGSLKENANVLSSTNADNARARQGLSFIANALKDPEFAAARAKLLFPAAPAGQPATAVQATRDWVLFHRRRTTSCESAVVTPPKQAPPRHYQVWMGVAANEDAVKQLMKAMADRTSIDPQLVFFQKVDTVDFAGGAATLNTGAADIKRDWSNAKPGERLVYGAIASVGAALEEGAALAKSRLEAVEQVVSSISKPDGLISQVLDAAHPDTGAPGLDGVIVLVTLREVKTTCHSVYRVIDPATFNNVVKMALEGQIDTPQWNNLTDKLGNVSFKFDTLDVLDSSMQPVIDAWNTQKGGEPVSAAVEMRKGYPEDNSQAIQLKRALAIQKALGGKLTTATAGEADTTPDCPMVTLIAGQPPQQPTIGRLLFQTDSITSGKRFFATTNPAVISVKQNPDGTIATGLTPPMIAGLRAVAPNLVGLVELAPSKAPINIPETKAATARLDAIFAALGAANLLKAGAKKQLVTLLSFEQNQLDLGGGAKADDLIYLQP